MSMQVTLSAIRKIVQEETKKVFEEKSSKFATKEDLKNLATKNDLIKFKDQIISEIEKSREEMIVTKGYGNQLEDHGERISTLEKTSHTHP